MFLGWSSFYGELTISMDFGLFIHKIANLENRCFVTIDFVHTAQLLFKSNSRLRYSKHRFLLYFTDLVVRCKSKFVEFIGNICFCVSVKNRVS